MKVRERIVEGYFYSFLSWLCLNHYTKVLTFKEVFIDITEAARAFLASHYIAKVLSIAV